MAEGAFKSMVDLSKPLVSLSADHRSEIERLLSRIEADEASELAGLETYRRAAEDTSDEGVRFLMGLILEDEERHHRLLQAMAENLRKSLEWTRSGNPLPDIAPKPSAVDTLAAQAERFTQLEHQNLHDLRDLQKSVHDLESGLLDLILVTMEDDTKKHIQILEFIKKRLGASKRS
ncbi:MAG TPA: ferritin-like domain-containing protein [Chloroflexota bacterium]|nr:ferritin-like domain-containing protein [Chloroflexota bacterium]